MIRFYLLALVLISYTAFGQNNSTTKTRNFYIGYSFSPDYCDFRQVLDEDKLSDNALSGYMHEGETYIGKFTYSTGIAIGFDINHLLGIETGLEYSDKGFRTKPVDIGSDDPFFYSVYGRIIYNYSYLDIPCKVNFKLSDNKFHYVASVGLVFNYLLDAEVVTVPDNSEELFKQITYVIPEGYQVFKDQNLASFVSFGFRYKLNQKLNFVADIYQTYNFYAKYENVRRNLWIVGLNFGVNLNL